jgi:hypothetical protein
MGCRARWPFGPYLLDQLLGGDDLIGVEEQDGQQGLLLRRPEIEFGAVGHHLQ